MKVMEVIIISSSPALPLKSELQPAWNNQHTHNENHPTYYEGSPLSISVFQWKRKTSDSTPVTSSCFFLLFSGRCLVCMLFFCDLDIGSFTKPLFPIRDGLQPCSQQIVMMTSLFNQFVVACFTPHSMAMHVQ